MAHASPLPVAVDHEQNTVDHQQKPLLPLYYHGNKKSHDPSADEPTPLYVLGIPLHKLSKTNQFLVCVIGIMFFYLLYGYTQVLACAENVALCAVTTL